jgi:septum site-determining protein MinC
MAAGNLVQGALFTVMVVRAGMLRDVAFAQALARQVELSPRFFLNAPVVLDLKGDAAFTTAAEFAEAREILYGHTLALVGVQNAEPAQLAAAVAARLASFAPSLTASRRPPRPPETHPGESRPAEPAPVEPLAEPAGGSVQMPAAAQAAPAAPRAAARLVTEPVRSGVQIYARGTDLVVTAAVSPGAEIVADGNIHVYGVLRGRAMAGASGDGAARIFCSRFEAELVSIAGHYLVSEQLSPELRGSPVQIALDDDLLTITRI